MQTYNNGDELYHYGVLGMKWGVRKKRDSYVTVRQANKNAKLAGRKAAKDAVNRMNDSPNKHTLRQYNNAAKKAHTQAAKESIKADKAYNKQLRSEKKTLNNPNKKRETAIAIGSVAGTALAAYGVYKVSSAIKDKNFKHAMRNGAKTLEYWAEKGKLDIGLDNVRATFDANYGASISTIIRNNISNNSVNGRVDWKAVRNIYK